MGGGESCATSNDGKDNNTQVAFLFIQSLGKLQQISGTKNKINNLAHFKSIILSSNLFLTDAWPDQKSTSRDTGCSFANLLAHICVAGIDVARFAALQDIKITY